MSLTQPALGRDDASTDDEDDDDFITPSYEELFPPVESYDEPFSPPRKRQRGDGARIAIVGGIQEAVEIRTPIQPSQSTAEVESNSPVGRN